MGYRLSLITKPLVVVVIAVIALSTAAFGWGNFEANAAAHPESVDVPAPSGEVYPESIMLPVATGTIETCELACWDGPCDPGEHDAFDTLDPGTWDAIRNGGAHHTEPLCRSGTCDTKHGPLPCDPYVDLPQGRVDVLQALRVAVLASDPETVAQIIAHGGDRVALNASRSAVQVTGCRGGIVAHLPLSADFLGLVKLAASGDDD